MRTRHVLFPLALGLAIAACGGDDTGGDSTGSGSSGGDDGKVNGCDPAAAADHTADAEVTINFGNFQYDPACIRIKAGSKVTWKGAFGSHFLTGGTASGGKLTPDASSPIKETKSGDSATFEFPTAGTFPYYCIQHGASGMAGAVFVE